MGDASAHKHDFALLFRSLHLGRARFDVKLTTSLEKERRNNNSKEVNAQLTPYQYTFTDDG